MPGFGTIVLAMIVLMFAYQLARGIFNIINRFVDAIVKAPGKGLKKVWFVLRNRKLNRLNRKLERAVMKEDKKARLNAALRNPSYLNSAKAKKIQNKIEAIELKRK